MKRIVLSLFAATAMTAAASAADLPRRAQPAYIAPVFTWTGFYAGLNAGYGFFNDENLDGVYSNNKSEGGFVGGGQFGYNYQMGSIVLGLEADIQYASLSRKAFDSAYTRYGYVDGEFKNEVSWYGTVRPRIGFVPMDRLMIFVTGGLAYGQVENSVSVVARNGSYNAQESKDDTRIGWTVGAGAEYAVTNNITVRGEYAYVDLGSKDQAFFAGREIPAYLSTNNNFHVVRAAVNYKF